MQKLFISFKKYKNINIALFCILLLLSLFYFVSQIDKQNNLEVVFLDVGQGDSALVKTGSGQKVLIDAGANYITLQKLQEYLPIFSKSIDILLLTHPDMDHVGGSKEILDFIKVKNVIISSENKYEDYIGDFETTKVSSKQRIILDKDLGLEILNPEKSQNGDDNHNAIVNRLVYGSFEFVFMADVGVEIERNLVSFGYFENKDTKKILKIGHHGSDTSSSEIFLKKIKPEYCIISLGKDNKYGHPNREVLLRLEKYCKNIYRTDKNGDISFTTDGSHLKIRTEK